MSEPSAGVDEWVERTSAFDRVQAVASSVTQPRSASDIADEAYVAENTARDHLERLVDLAVLLKHESGGTTLYSPDPLHTRMETLRDLVAEHNRADLIQLKADLQSEIETWEQEYGVGSPTELRDRAADTSTASETREIQTTASEWELLAYRLSIVEDAIDNYATYDGDFQASA